MPRTRRTPAPSASTSEKAPSAVPPSLLEMLNQYGDPVALAELIDNDDPDAGSPEQRAFIELRGRFLSGFRNEAELKALYHLVENVENFSLIERAIKLAGFVMGFTVATRLLTGQAPAGGGRQ